jgi:hypothetical protein
VKPPPTVVTVIVVVAGNMNRTGVIPVVGVTTPLATVATAGALEDQVTLLLVAFAGATVATNVPVTPPTVKVMVAGFKVTPVTATGVGVGARQPVMRRAVKITKQTVTKPCLLNITLSSFLYKVNPKYASEIFTQIFCWIHLIIILFLDFKT